ncbi:MAG TPA: ATP-binding protein [Candidatus Marinimicrobia bacterium]|jgi:polar amino acid transport system ATP-binding protein|nr:ATP-binding protein [Candidatus Neomarinimicrobiota bacterium]|tara:strand:- start:385 stop:1152 length:768 start_codon:yes stop_codon:yes gene_type:complete
MSHPLIQVKNLYKSFGDTEVLKGVSIDINRGEVVSIIGPSGSGKTTLLRCINVLTKYDKGSIKIDNVEIGYTSDDGKNRKERSENQLSEFRSELGMVFQLFYLFPHLTALENVMLGLRKVRKLSKVKATDQAKYWLQRVGLTEKINSLPSEMSGGQQQRVGIARAVAMDPKVLLLDEITSALDPELVGEVLEVVQKLVEDGMTMIIVTHEMSFAKDVSNRIVFMDEGKIEIDGTPSEIFDSKNERLNTFLARIKK